MEETGRSLPVHPAAEDMSRILFKYTMAREYVCRNCTFRVLIPQNDVMGAGAQNPIHVNPASMAVMVDEKIVNTFRGWPSLARWLHRKGYTAKKTWMRQGGIECTSTWGESFWASLAWRIGTNLIECEPPREEWMQLLGYTLKLEKDEAPVGTWQATWAREEWVLRIFNTHVQSNHRMLVGYDLTDMGELIFSGNSAYLAATDRNDFDHERVALELLEFLAMEKLDTEDSYFDDYTALQLAWRDQRAADLKMYVYDRNDELDRIEEAAEEAEKVSAAAELARSEASSRTRAPRGVRLRPPK